MYIDPLYLDTLQWHFFDSNQGVTRPTANRNIDSLSFSTTPSLFFLSIVANLWSLFVLEKKMQNAKTSEKKKIENRKSRFFHEKSGVHYLSISSSEKFRANFKCVLQMMCVCVCWSSLPLLNSDPVVDKLESIKR